MSTNGKLENYWNGARWWKFDFHAHTPASSDYGKGSSQLELGKLTPKEWLLAYMKAEIDCVAITDHNSGEWIDKLKSAYIEMKNNKEEGFREIYLFSYEAVIEIINSKGGIAIPAHIDQTPGLFTWVKMGIPSLEGLKLALLDGDLSIKRSDTYYENPNEQHSTNFIESITIEKSKYIGRNSPLELQLNPWMSSFIGGRGTGKSSLMEFVRLAMRRQDEIPNSLKEEFRKYSEVGNRKEKGLLTEDAKFSLVYKKNQTGYKINWALKSDQMHPIESFNGSEWVKEEGSIKDRFPISIYSQKQIYSFAENPKHLLDMISDQKQIGYKEWLDKKNILEANFFSYKNRLRELSLLLEKESALKGELSDVTKKISLLEEKGFQEILNEFQKRQNQSGYMDAWESNIFSLPEKIGILEEEIVPLSYPEEMIDEKDTTDVELLKMIQTFNSDLNKLKSLLITQKDQLTVSLQKWNDEKQNSIWFKKFQESIKQYEETLKELSTGSINAQDEFGKMFQIKHNLETSLQKIEFTKVECERVKRDIEKTLNEIVEHRKLLSTQRQNFLNEVFKTNQSVKIRLIPFGNKIDVESQLREILRMESGFEPIIGSMESNEGFIFDLYENGIDESKISNLKGKLLGLLEGKDFSAIGRYNQFKERILKLTSQSIDQLELYFPDDSLAIEYKNASGKYQPIEQGSPGQKTAALLSFVLSYGNDPIILDQPEDDLDNRLIYELIVKQLKESKSKRQIIVVTHNANIVVNGDSELVFCLSSNGQTCLSSQGCLQDKKIREEICSILEGGKDAFQLRYKKD